MLKVGIVGAAGYAGAELVRIVLRHPEFDLRVITSNSDEGATLASVYPAFSGVTDLAFSRHDNAELFNCDVVFLATPHTVAMKSAPGLLDSGVRWLIFLPTIVCAARKPTKNGTRCSIPRRIFLLLPLLASQS